MHDGEKIALLPVGESSYPRVSHAAAWATAAWETA
jgi:hypothetical protein